MISSHNNKKYRNQLVLGVLALLALGYYFFSGRAPTDTADLPLPPVAETPAVAPTASPVASPVTDKTLHIIVQSGDTLGKLFHDHRISQNLLPQLLANKKYLRSLQRLKPRSDVYLTISPTGELNTLCLPLTLDKNIVFERANQFKAREVSRALDRRTEFALLHVKHSLYLAGKTARLSDALLKQLRDIFHWQLDFARDIRPGDTVSLMYESYYQGEKKVRDGNIVVARITNRGRHLQAIRYVSPQGEVHYYSPDGYNLQKAFNRYPVKHTHISSLFNRNRLHPILKIRRPHNGIDYAAPLGTPIQATGTGNIIFIGRKGGYGNMIKIRHYQKYTTIYAHLHKFKAGLLKGHRVKQGDIIGFVGQTGLASAPHLHYEFRIHGQPRNPLTTPLPQAADLSPSRQREFKLHAQKILAQLDLGNQPKIVLNTP